MPQNSAPTKVTLRELGEKLITSWARARKLSFLIKSSMAIMLLLRERFKSRNGRNVSLGSIMYAHVDSWTGP